MNRYPHLHSICSEVMNATDEQRCYFLEESRWIGYDRAKKIHSLLERMITNPKRTRANNLLISGDPNNGKTTLIKRFVENYTEQVNYGVEVPTRPVIVAEAPPSADEKGLYVSILERFWAPYSASSPKSKLLHQIIHLLRETEVKMLIIDEVHSMITGSVVKQREVMNSIKSICNTVGIPVVLAGTSEAVRVLHLDPQHRTRFNVAELPSWELDASFQRLLRGFEMVMPLRKESKIYDSEKATLIYEITNGVIGDVNSLVCECATKAIETGKEYIDLEIIKSTEWIKYKDGVRTIQL